MTTFAFVFIISLTVFSQTCRANDNSAEPTEKLTPKSMISRKNDVCEQQFDLVHHELEKLGKQFPVMSGFQKSVRVEHQDSKNGVSHHLYYDNNFSGHSKSGKQSYAIDAGRSYASVSFSLGTTQYEGQAVMIAIDAYLRDRKPRPLQHGFRSGIIIFADATTDDQELKKKVYSIFDQAIDNILSWEKSEK